jgi:hypothetical protein
LEEALFSRGGRPLGVDEELVELGGQVDGREELTLGRVDASGGTISGVGGASDVDGMEGVEGFIDADGGMEAFEDLIDGTVATPAVPPTFDHSLVISVYGEVAAS